MISSLLNLQSHQLKGHPAAESLKAGKYRVEALSLVHQKLYQEDYNTKIALNEYIEELALNLVHCFDKKVKLNLELENIEVDIDTAIPLGLIVNELVTNSLKHAFNKEINPVLDISIKQINNQLIISIKDNGEGIADINSNGKTDSFGLKLVNSLLKQLNGQLEYKNNNGCSWKISILN
jgi:two-component sensor histidine kinase